MEKGIQSQTSSILGLIFSPFDACIFTKFNGLLSEIKNNSEKDAICLTTVGVGCSVCSAPALSYLTSKHKLKTNNFMTELPKAIIFSFWEYLPMFVCAKRNPLQSYLHFFTPFLPQEFDNKILNLLIKTNNQFLVVAYAQKMQKVHDGISLFLSALVKELVPTLIQPVISQIIQIDLKNTILALCSIIEANCPNGSDYMQTQYMAEYGLSIAISAINCQTIPVDMQTVLCNMASLFLCGKIELNSKLFGCFCYFAFRNVKSISADYIDLNNNDMPAYIFSHILSDAKNVTAIKTNISKFIIKNGKPPVFPFETLFLFFEVFDENFCKLFAKQLLLSYSSTPKFWQNLTKIYNKAIEDRNNCAISVLNHTICALFGRLQLSDPSFDLASIVVRKLTEIKYPLSFFRKVSDMYADDTRHSQSLQLLKELRNESTSVLIVFSQLISIFETNSFNDINKYIANILESRQAETILALYSLLSSKIFISDKTRRSVLVSMINEIVEVLKNDSVLIVKITILLPKEIRDCITDYKKLINEMVGSLNKNLECIDITDQIVAERISNEKMTTMVTKKTCTPMQLSQAKMSTFNFDPQIEDDSD